MCVAAAADVGKEAADAAWSDDDSVIPDCVLAGKPTFASYGLSGGLTVDTNAQYRLPSPVGRRRPCSVPVRDIVASLAAADPVDCVAVFDSLNGTCEGFTLTDAAVADNVAACRAAGVPAIVLTAMSAHARNADVAIAGCRLLARLELAAAGSVSTSSVSGNGSAATVAVAAAASALRLHRYNGALVEQCVSLFSALSLTDDGATKAALAGVVDDVVGAMGLHRDDGVVADAGLALLTELSTDVQYTDTLMTVVAPALTAMARNAGTVSVSCNGLGLLANLSYTPRHARTLCGYVNLATSCALRHVGTVVVVEHWLSYLRHVAAHARCRSGLLWLIEHAVTAMAMHAAVSARVARYSLSFLELLCQFIEADGSDDALAALTCFDMAVVAGAVVRQRDCATTVACGVAVLACAAQDGDTHASVLPLLPELLSATAVYVSAEDVVVNALSLVSRVAGGGSDVSACVDDGLGPLLLHHVNCSVVLTRGLRLVNRLVKAGPVCLSADSKVCGRGEGGGGGRGVSSLWFEFLKRAVEYGSG